MRFVRWTGSFLLPLTSTIKLCPVSQQAKTIEEIHAEAHAELGMMPATLIPALESLSALPRQAADEVELFPSFKGGMVFFHLCLLSGAQAKPTLRRSCLFKLCSMTICHSLQHSLRMHL